jgi:HNH endonuclease/NUMOD3 motif-containing protein
MGTIGKHWKWTSSSKEKYSQLVKQKGRVPPSQKGVNRTIETRKKMSNARKGPNNPFWRGGVTPLHIGIRHSFEYKLWRESLFKRDNYACVWCGVKSGNGKAVVLNADHIKPFALFPELRFAIDNGRTLCKNCHKTTETYGGKSHKK